MTDPMTDSVTDPITDPVTDCMTDSTTDPMTDPIYSQNYNVRAILHSYDVFKRMLSRLAACLASVRKTSRCVTGTSTCSRYLSQCNFFTFPNVTFFLHKPKTSVFMLCFKFYFESIFEGTSLFSGGRCLSFARRFSATRLERGS